MICLYVITTANTQFCDESNLEKKDYLEHKFKVFFF